MVNEDLRNYLKCLKGPKKKKYLTKPAQIKGGGSQLKKTFKTVKIVKQSKQQKLPGLLKM